MEKTRKTALEMEKEEDETQKESATQQKQVGPFLRLSPEPVGVWGNLASLRAPVIQE